MRGKRSNQTNKPNKRPARGKLRAFLESTPVLIVAAVSAVAGLLGFLG